MFKVKTSDEFLTRSVHNGVSVMVKVTVTTAEPAEVTAAELLAHLQQHAKQGENGGWEVDDHPILGSFDTCGDPNIAVLVVEAASILNSLGVSISDMAAYKLEVDS